MRQDRRQAFIEKLGTLPETCPLDPVVEERTVEDGIVRERITFMASPGVRVPAYLLTPEGLSGKAPAILAIHQHAGQFHLGKSEPAGLAGNPEMFYALELCKRGYVTIAPDLEAFEDRRASSEDRERWKEHTPEGGNYERYVATRYLQRGGTLQGRYVWDLARAVDYLCTRPEVDPSRIGTIGHSLGGQEVCWALLFDRRLKAGVSSCGIGTFETIFRDGINHNFAAYLPGLLQVGDIDTLVAALAPTPFMMTAGTQDRIFPIDGVYLIAQVAAEAYREAGAPDAFRFIEFAGGHGFPPEVRVEAYAWLDRWVKGQGSAQAQS